MTRSGPGQQRSGHQDQLRLPAHQLPLGPCRLLEAAAAPGKTFAPSHLVRGLVTEAGSLRELLGHLHRGAAARVKRIGATEIGLTRLEPAAATSAPRRWYSANC